MKPLLLMGLGLALIPATAFSTPVIRTGPTPFSSSRVDESSCLWNGTRYSVGATFCAGTDRVQACTSPDRTHGDARWVVTLDKGQCNPATYPNSR